MPIKLDDPLTTLAIRHGTDKFGFHRYTPVYHMLLARYRDRPVRLLEIGIGGYKVPDQGGQSLAAWRDYFPQGQITGIDIARKTMDLGPRVRILQGSQVDHGFLAALVRDHGPFDIIIDDGSHQNAHVIESFQVLFPTLSPGGIYVAEDVQTAFIVQFGGTRAMDAPNSMAFFRDLMPSLPLAADHPALPGLAGIERFHNMIALHKAGSAGAPALDGHAAWDILPAAPIAVVLGDAPCPPRLIGAQVVDPVSERAVADAIILPAATATPATVTQALATTRDPGLVILQGQTGADLAKWLQDRFVEHDHTEIRAQFPDATVDPLAHMIYGMIWLADGIMLIRAANDYPSNFGFDVANPSATAVLDHIGATLDAMPDAPENGIVSHAAMLGHLYGPERAARWLDRLDALGASSRMYYRLAVDQAEKSGDAARAATLCIAALQHYPDAHDLVVILARLHLVAGRAREARAVVAAGLDALPDHVSLHLLMVRVAERLQLADLALGHAERAAALAPEKARLNTQITLGLALRLAGRMDAAEALLTEITTGIGAGSGRAWRELSGLHAARNAHGPARAAADRAVELSPKNAEHARWQASLAGKD